MLTLASCLITSISPVEWAIRFPQHISAHYLWKWGLISLEALGLGSLLLGSSKSLSFKIFNTLLKFFLPERANSKEIHRQNSELLNMICFIVYFLLCLHFPQRLLIIVGFIDQNMTSKCSSCSTFFFI